MIELRIEMHMLPEKHQEIRQTLLSMTGAMKKDPGCLGFRLFQDMEDAHRVCVLEEWRDRETLEHYFRSDIFGVLLGIRSLLCAPHTLHLQTIDRSEGMEAVRAVRQRDTAPANRIYFKECNP